jgi:hypothetical protein
VIFVASSIIHMMLKYHKADHKRLPNEDMVRDALGKASLAPGMYFTPHCADHKEMKDPAKLDQFNKGPVAIITSLPKGMPNMGKHLGLWFTFCLLVSFTAAYVARMTLQAGDAGLMACRVTGTVAFAGYGLSQISDSIWKGQPWGNTFRHLLDAVIYAVLTGLVFMYLWPAA